MSNQQYDNTNKGVLFKNLQRTSEKSPDYRGTINIDGRELELAAWVRKSQRGVSFMSLAVSEPRARDGAARSQAPAPGPAPAPAPARQAAVYDDDIPFILNATDLSFDHRLNRRVGIRSHEDIL